MMDLVQYAADGSIILLCRRFRDRVLCVHQVFGRGPQELVSYERGRPMPLFRGATSKIILAYVAPRELKVLFAAKAKEIAKAGLGQSWEQFATELKALRRARVCVTRGEVDRGRIGIAAPIFDKEGSILGSLTFVVLESRTDGRVIDRLVPLTIAGAREIEHSMANGDSSAKISALHQLTNRSSKTSQPIRKPNRRHRL
jgi:DNA-binding IclR family transcriptional regulator